VVAVWFLANAAHLLHSSFWSGVVALMLLGYLAAPHGIWHLCVGTHTHADGKEQSAQSFQQP
jgi:hypothetical protein